MNNFFNAFGGFQNFKNQFDAFRQNMQNQKVNPQQKIQEMLNSGQITQEQFEQARQIANQITGKNY